VIGIVLDEVHPVVMAKRQISCYCATVLGTQ